MFQLGISRQALIGSNSGSCLATRTACESYIRSFQAPSRIVLLQFSKAPQGT